MQLNTTSLANITVAVVFLFVHADVPLHFQNPTWAVDIEKPKVGPETETRFPPLFVPDGFKTTLFACDPLVEYPSVISIGPRTGTLFVAHDYLTGLGIEIVRRDEVRLLADTDQDGYADKSTVFAQSFNSIQGLAFYDGTVFVMHAPLLTSLQDTDGDDVADVRRDLIKGLGLPPEENSNRLHCANGVVIGHDGWLYLALGDRGCDVDRPEGDRLLFRQGGILRCRPDGTDLHVFSTGLRNIYDIALDNELNVFVRDNENDGGNYMTRVCHCFFGSDHGYPYQYYEHPIETMPPLADLGRGSSAGVATYLETVFPEPYQNSLFACEWGRAVVRYQRKQLGSSFEPMEEIDFAYGAPEDPYGFKPTDLVVDRDGSLLISDWCDGQRPQRGRGRIYRIAYAGNNEQDFASENDKSTTHKPRPPTLDDWIAKLNSPSHHQRVEAQLQIEHAGQAGYAGLMRAVKRGSVNKAGRLHAIWIITAAHGQEAIATLSEFAQTDLSMSVRIQAIRAIADLADPVLVKDKLDAGRGNTTISKQLAELPVDHNPHLLREVAIALGRLKWANAPHWLSLHMNNKHDAAIRHTASWTFRQANNWPYIFTIWDDPLSPARPAALDAGAKQTNPIVVDALLKRCMNRAEYAKMLARVYKKPPPYKYWGFRPPPRPANSVSWDLSEAIKTKLIEVFPNRNEDSAKVRKQILREGVPIPTATLARCLPEESDGARLGVVLDALKEKTNQAVPGLFMEVIKSPHASSGSRLTALGYLVKKPDQTNGPRLLELAKSIEDGLVLAEVIQNLGNHPTLEFDKFLVRKLHSKSGAVRAATLHALAVRKYDGMPQQAIGLLDDKDVRVRRAAVFAAGTLGIKSATNRLLQLAVDDDRETCRASLNALRELGQPDAVQEAVVALRHPETQLAAIAYLADHGGPQQLDSLTSIANNNRSIDVLTKVVDALSRWENNPKHGHQRPQLHIAISRIQAASEVLLRWTIFGPLAPDETKTFLNQLVTTADPTTAHVAVNSSLDNRVHRQIQLATGTDARVVVDVAGKANQESTWLAVTHLENPVKSNVEFFASSNATLHIWLNAKSVYQRDRITEYQPNEDHFGALLPRGTSKLVIQIANAKEQPNFHLRFRRKSSKTKHEQLTQMALSRQGNFDRGRKVFTAVEKSQCAKCHRIGNNDVRIGPDLTGIGNRFSRIHLIESILDPSRTVAPSYETVHVILMDGRQLSGVKIKDDNKAVAIGDNQGKVHSIVKTNIEEIQIQSHSTMPEGLEERLTDQEFIDLLAYLLAQKNK